MPTCSASAALHWRLPGVPTRATPAISRVSLVLAAVPVDAAGSEDHQCLTKELPPSNTAVPVGGFGAYVSSLGGAGVDAGPSSNGGPALRPR